MVEREGGKDAKGVKKRENGMVRKGTSKIGGGEPDRGHSRYRRIGWVKKYKDPVEPAQQQMHRKKTNERPMGFAFGEGDTTA